VTPSSLLQLDHDPMLVDRVSPATGPANPVYVALDAVHAVAHLLAQEPDRTAMAERLAPLLQDILRADIAVVAPIEDGAVAHCATAASGSSAPCDTPAVRALLEAVAQRRQRAHTTDLPGSVDGAAELFAAIAWAHVLAVPVLHLSGHAVGVLLVANLPGHAAFHAADVRLLETIAEQLVVALDRAQLLARLGEWSRGMEALLAFSAAVHRQADPPALVDEMVEHAARFLKADGGRAGLLVRGAAEGEAVLASRAHWHAGAWRARPRRWGAREGIPGRVLDHEFPYLSADYAADPLAEPDLVAWAQVRHALAVPIRDSTHRVVGFFEVHRGPDRQPFSWNDAALLESLADTTAVAIDNARLVAALAAKNDEIRRLFHRHAERLEEERAHIARELHDEAGQALVGVKLSLQALARAIPAASPAVRALDELRTQVNEATGRLRDLARTLRPPTLDQHGLGVALEQLARDVEQRSGLAVALDTAWLPERRLPLVETAVFRVVQEALTNVAAHARATRAEVTVGVCDGALWLKVADDGAGFDPTAPTAGMGLRGIAERVQELRGEVRVDAAPGRGTVLWARLPLD
jgi:signal transduction histidine kinase